MKTIGILALQGDFLEHIRVIESLGVKGTEIRDKKNLEECDGLIIPGGESTTIAKLLVSSGLGNAIKTRVKEGMPVYGTCAGAIVVAKKVVGETRFKPLGLIDIEIKRNAYGRQIDSFEAPIKVKGLGEMNGIFIRAPIISKAGKKTEVLAKFEGKPVLVKQDNVLVGTFHPETDDKTTIHEFFLELCSK